MHCFLETIFALKARYKKCCVNIQTISKKSKKIRIPAIDRLFRMLKDVPQETKFAMTNSILLSLISNPTATEIPVAVAYFCAGEKVRN